MLLTNAVEPHASDVISEAWFYVATSFPIFWPKYGMEDAGTKKLAFFSLIFSQEMGIMASAALKWKSFIS